MEFTGSFYRESALSDLAPLADRMHHAKFSSTSYTVIRVPLKQGLPLRAAGWISMYSSKRIGDTPPGGRRFGPSIVIEAYLFIYIVQTYAATADIAKFLLRTVGDFCRSWRFADSMPSFNSENLVRARSVSTKEAERTLSHNTLQRRDNWLT